jgi:hypothetical protein
MRDTRYHFVEAQMSTCASTLSFSPMVKTSGKGNRGVVGILCHLLQHFWQEHSR